MRIVRFSGAALEAGVEERQIEGVKWRLFGTAAARGNAPTTNCGNMLRSVAWPT
jgi:hypothetical protein